jgi:polyadenylate-binding protein
MSEYTLYIGDIPENATKRNLFECFKGFGITSLSLKKKDNRKPQYAFATFETEEEAEIFIEEFNYSKIGKETIHISWSDSEADKIMKSGKGKLIIKNLDWNLEDFQLYQILAQYGEVFSCKISRNDGISNGFGFVQFVDSDDAENAKTSLNGRFVNSRRIIVENIVEAKYVKK